MIFKFNIQNIKFLTAFLQDTPQTSSAVTTKRRFSDVGMVC
jgi:hypothetical protein